MMHYHGTPLSSLANAARVLSGRHAMASYATAGSYVDVIAAACQSCVLDCGAFTMWRSGRKYDLDGCYKWYGLYLPAPNCDWALIPDVIDGSEQQNDDLLKTWPFRRELGVPVWHYHESLTRLEQLAEEWPRVALGSSGEWPVPGRTDWWQRTDQAMRVVCDSEGRPRAKLHGLRMLDPDVFTRMPLASADSCNAGRNCGVTAGRLGIPADAAAELIIRRIEQHNSAPTWQTVVPGVNANLFGDAA